VASTAGGVAGFGASLGLSGQEPVVRLVAGCLAFAVVWVGVWLGSPGGRAEVFGMFALLKRVRAGKAAG